MIEVGERAPDFALPTGEEGATRFYGQVGGATSLLVLAGNDSERGADLADRLRDDLGIDVALVACSPPSDGRAAYRDPEGGVHGAYDVDPDGGAVVLVLDPNVRVAATHGPITDVAADLDEVAGSVRALADDRAGSVVQGHAPVLLVPGAISEDLCDEVIALWEAADPVETGVETMADGRRVDALDHLRKRRRDHIVTDREFQRLLTSHIGRRVIPELKKAFAYDASRFEGFKIGCYTDEDEGFFAAHRDNLSEATAHRRFALSVNLNAPDDYDGGGLCFPEYGPDVYRPDRGEALVFSGSHLHEVQPVTRGRRFVLLSFLFGR
ncbi:MAG: 2OG-Fe(II) oxygenase [Trueperaceae bacterium]|nr:2OG-Fe(II) oxygenase [Trueperaceae bacterium]